MSMKHLIVEYKGIEKFYYIDSYQWNWWLDRYYPHATCYLEIIKKKNIDQVKIE